MEHVVQFDTKRRTLPGFDILPYGLMETLDPSGKTAAAWLSSALVVRCSLKWGIERNPYPVLYITGNCPAQMRGGRRG